MLTEGFRESKYGNNRNYKTAKVSKTAKNEAGNLAHSSLKASVVEDTA